MWRIRLDELSDQRATMQQKLSQYKALQALLEPFKRPQENVQPNLVTRDGELAKELDKMRMLLVRVAGRIEGSHVSKDARGDDDDDNDDISIGDSEERLSTLLQRR